MSAKLKKILSFLFIAASVTAVFFIAFSNAELKDAWGAIARLDLLWVAGIFGCWIICTVFDGGLIKRRFPHLLVLTGRGFRGACG